MLSLFVLSFVLLVIGFWVNFEYNEYKTGVPTFPTMAPARRKIIEFLKKDSAQALNSPYTILDLGSGSGQLSWRIARAMPNAKMIGIELAYIPWLRSILRQKLFGPKNLEYKRADFWSYDSSKFDAVFTYLPGKIMERVGAKLREELKPQALVIANVFPLRAGWEPQETLSVRVPFKTKMFVYRQEKV